MGRGVTRRGHNRLQIDLTSPYPTVEMLVADHQSASPKESTRRPVPMSSTRMKPTHPFMTDYSCDVRVFLSNLAGLVVAFLVYLVMQRKLRKLSDTNTKTKESDPQDKFQLTHLSEDHLLAQYSAVNSRHQNWTSLIHEAPATALTGLAFLLLIALDANATDSARLISATLSFFVSTTAISSMGRFRMSEIADDEYLRDIDIFLKLKQSDGQPVPGDAQSTIHGKNWSIYRQDVGKQKQQGAKRFSLDWISYMLGARRTFLWWIFVFLLIDLASLLIIVSTLFSLDLFAGRSP